MCCVQVSVDATDPFSLMEALEAPQPDFAAASDSILVATGNGAGGAVSEALGFLLSNETRANATNDDVRCPPCDLPSCMHLFEKVFDAACGLPCMHLLPAACQRNCKH